MGILKLPSIPAAILAGGIVPLCAWVWQYLDETFHNQLLVLVWAMIGFLVPMLFSTADTKYVVRKWREEGLFRSGIHISLEDFEVFYIPAWIRMLVWFGSAVVSYLILEAAGLELP